MSELFEIKLDDRFDRMRGYVKSLVRQMHMEKLCKQLSAKQILEISETFSVNGSDVLNFYLELCKNILKRT